MTLNITCDLLQEEMLLVAHNGVAVPALIVGFIVGFLIILTIGIIMFNTSSGRKKFFGVWATSVIVVGGVYIFLSLSPSFVQSISNLFGSLWI